MQARPPPGPWQSGERGPGRVTPHTQRPMGAAAGGPGLGPWVPAPRSPGRTCWTAAHTHPFLEAAGAWIPTATLPEDAGTGWPATPPVSMLGQSGATPARHPLPVLLLASSGRGSCTQGCQSHAARASTSIWLRGGRGMTLRPHWAGRWPYTANPVGKTELIGSLGTEGTGAPPRAAPLLRTQRQSILRPLWGCPGPGFTLLKGVGCWGRGGVGCLTGGWAGSQAKGPPPSTSASRPGQKPGGSEQPLFSAGSQ